MAARLNERGYEYACRLIGQGQEVLDDRDEQSEHGPSAQQENSYIAEQGFGEFGRWYLGVDDGANGDTKSHYRFPYGDFEKVHRCGVLSAESRAGQCKCIDIALAAAHLQGMLEEVIHTASLPRKTGLAISCSHLGWATIRRPPGDVGDTEVDVQTGKPGQKGWVRGTRNPRTPGTMSGVAGCSQDAAAATAC